MKVSELIRLLQDQDPTPGVDRGLGELALRERRRRRRGAEEFVDGGEDVCDDDERAGPGTRKGTASNDVFLVEGPAASLRLEGRVASSRAEWSRGGRFFVERPC
ncbi:MAG: hypothetical protein IPG96_16680 [Proteobacteria bacterium]|nr:hypothetical protein [Pseudomonadota bacterium]